MAGIRQARNDDQDCLTVWSIRNEPSVRLASRWAGKANLQQHAAYWGNAYHQYWIDPSESAYVRISDHEISVAVYPHLRGMGIGERLVRFAKKKGGKIAIIRSDNFPSQMLFSKCGFTKKDDDGALQTWVK